MVHTVFFLQRWWGAHRYFLERWCGARKLFLQKWCDAHMSFLQTWCDAHRFSYKFEGVVHTDFSYRESGLHTCYSYSVVHTDFSYKQLWGAHRFFTYTNIFYIRVPNRVLYVYKTCFVGVHVPSMFCTCTEHVQNMFCTRTKHAHVKRKEPYSAPTCFIRLNSIGICPADLVTKTQRLQSLSLCRATPTPLRPRPRHAHTTPKPRPRHAHATPKPGPSQAQAAPMQRPSHAHATPKPRPRHAQATPKPRPTEQARASLCAPPFFLRVNPTVNCLGKKHKSVSA